MEYQQVSQHQIDILSLSGHHWKWRMHGGAVTLARQYLSIEQAPDLILATDMLDVNTFLSLTRKDTSTLPIVLYFHENQLTYPRSSADKDTQLERDFHYSFINYTSALAADVVMFNSHYHQNSFLAALPEFLRRFPDHREQHTVSSIATKAQVLPIGLNFQSMKNIHIHLPETPVPLILWNHRWEFDKGPQDFFEALIVLSEQGAKFQLAVLGEHFKHSPPIFEYAREKLDDHIIKWGYVENVEEYVQWLYRADILPVTSLHDFFGISVVEALYCNTYPLLPANKVYQEYLPIERVPHFFYHSVRDFVESLANLLSNFSMVRNIKTRKWVEKYSWEYLSGVYDHSFSQIVIDKRGSNS